MFASLNRIRTKVAQLAGTTVPTAPPRERLQPADLAWLSDPEINLGHRDERGLLRSCLCTQEMLESPEFVRWVMRLEPHALQQDGQVRLHRKLWEYGYIVQALYERGLLRTGSRGLGFAVGREPLPAYFASLGCTILATDQEASQSQHQGWSQSRQHSDGLRNLNDRGLCTPRDFQRLVQFRAVDMNVIPADLRDFDFCWSSCSFEHLGSIRQGARFIERMLDTLKVGGVGVHTTEFNLLSSEATVDHQPTVLFRKRDIDSIADRVRQLGCHIDVVYQPGSNPADLFVDLPPYKEDPHLKLGLLNFTTTSIGLIVTKGALTGR